jgi:hypothetical protein
MRTTLIVIAAFGSLGYCIDFLIGRSGRERAKDFLTEWWIRFDDLHWRNFGKEEALFAASLIERSFGRRSWSLRRICSTISIYSILFFLTLITQFLLGKVLRLYNPYVETTQMLISLLMSCISISMSISLTRLVIIYTARLCGVGMLRNLTVWIGSLLLSYGISVILFWIIYFIKPYIVRTLSLNIAAYLALGWPVSWSDFDDILDTILGIIEHMKLSSFNPMVLLNLLVGEYQGLGHQYQSGRFNYVFLDGINVAITNTMSFGGYVLRIIISLIFFGSFLVKPLFAKPVSLLWVRIVESEKPVFTLLFGGVSALATGIIELGKHL